MWCDRLARAARTGSPLLRSLREVEPPDGLSDRFADVAHDLDRGRPLDQAFGHLPSDPDLDLAVTALLACRTNGIDPAPPLEQVATVLRWRAADAAELRSQSAQARASSKVMTVLPLVMLGLLVATSEMVRSAVTTPIGLIAATVGTALNLTGWMWMRGLIERAIR
jgi:Flp pilus assembly protein TadB